MCIDLYILSFVKFLTLATGHKYPLFVLVSKQVNNNPQTNCYKILTNCSNYAIIQP